MHVYIANRVTQPNRVFVSACLCVCVVCGDKRSVFALARLVRKVTVVLLFACLSVGWDRRTFAFCVHRPSVGVYRAQGFRVRVLKVRRGAAVGGEKTTLNVRTFSPRYHGEH